MLRRFKVRSFKSLVDVELEFPRLTVLFGPNAAGKSNLLDAIQALSRIATTRTLSDALSEPIRGYPVEAFTFPSGGLPALLSQQAARFSLEADLAIAKELFRCTSAACSKRRRTFECPTSFALELTPTVRNLLRRAHKSKPDSNHCL